MPVRRKIGGSFRSFINKAGDFLKKTKLLSTVGRQLAPLAGPYEGLASKAVDYAASQGYGRRRIRRGGALRPAGSTKALRMHGGMLNPVGGARMRSSLMRPRMPRRMPMMY